MLTHIPSSPLTHPPRSGSGGLLGELGTSKPAGRNWDLRSLQSKAPWLKTFPRSQSESPTSPRVCVSVTFPGDAAVADPASQLHNHSPGFSPWSCSSSLSFLISHRNTGFYSHFSSLFLFSIILPAPPPAQLTLWSFLK